MNQTSTSFGISARLAVGFCVVLVLLIIIAGYGIRQISSLGETFNSFSERSNSAIGATELQTGLMTLQSSLQQLSGRNSRADQDQVIADFATFKQSLAKQKEAAGDPALDNAIREIDSIVSGPASLAAIQHQVDKARGVVSTAASTMTSTVSAMLRDIGELGDIGAISTIQDRILRARMLIRSYQFTGSEDEVGDALAALRDAERKFDQFSRMGSKVANNALVKDGQKNLEAMFAGLADIHTAVKLREKTTSRVRQLQSDVTTLIRKLRDGTLVVMDQTSQQTRETVKSAFWNSAGAAGFAVVLGIFLAFFIGRSISRPIKSMTHAMRRLSEGDLTVAVPGTGRRDEIGDMAGAMQVFKDSASERQRAESETFANRQAAEEAKRKIEIEAADQAIASERAFVVAKFGVGIQGLADGDLTIRLLEEMPGEYEHLRHNFNDAIAQFGTTLRAVATAAAAIDGGSREISSGSDDLSKRTEQQAASLEETAAALDQITVNVKNSSKRADEARVVALQANTSAAESGKVVADAVGAMGKIEQSSNEISNIIGVIDEIAFQTNLLALNAGVEAARAGDAGKGFAVVAQEVRELAQRSAKAAKEIKDLIRNSSADVQSGVTLVRQTGEVLQTIEGYIVTVNQHMNAIATSAREQSVGLAEVNTAVNQMDQVTQQNAAMVEETNAASATLADEASRLQELIAQFRFGGDAGRQAAVLRQTASVMAAGARQRPVATPPARKIVAKAAKAPTGNAAVKESWEEF